MFVARWCVLALALLLASGIAWSYAGGGLAATLLSGELSAAEKLAALRAFFLNLGVAAPAAYVGFVTLEVVVAPLPGAMLYAPGGIVFGGFWGGVLSTLGNTLGAGLACTLTRLFGERLIRKMDHNDTWHRYAGQLDRRGLWIVALLRVNPLTSSDLVSYAAGLTPMATWKVMAGTALGMAPLCFAQSYLADGLLNAFPRLLYPLLVACAIYVVIVLWVLKSMAQKAHRQAACESGTTVTEAQAPIIGVQTSEGAATTHGG